jgi:EpsD family peptidyl-prolyl cis-trans isomerase
MLRGAIVEIFRYSVIIGICAALSVSCTRNADQAPPSNGQVVARVGSESVATLELDNELRLAKVPVEKRQDPAVVKQVLGEIVLRKYLVEQALKAKLDQEPDVLLDVMRAREQVLASAYMARQVAHVVIARSDIDKFIAENPAKFSDRRLLTVDQIRFALGSNVEEIVAANKSAVSLDEIDKKLTSMDVAHNRSIGELSEGDLTEKLAHALEAGKPDGVFLARSGPNGTYFKVKSTEARPLEGEAATTAARQYLERQSVQALLASASGAARLETKFADRFAKIMAVEDKTAGGGTNQAVSKTPDESASAANQ